MLRHSLTALLIRRASEGGSDDNISGLVALLCFLGPFLAFSFGFLDAVLVRLDACLWMYGRHVSKYMRACGRD